MFVETKIRKPTKILHLFVFVYEVSGIKKVYVLHVEMYAIFFSQIDEKFLEESRVIHGLSITFSFIAGDHSDFDKH